MRERRRRQLIPLEFAPGVVKDATADTPRGYWLDTQWVRFRISGDRSFVEKMGGWVRHTTSTISGVVRAIHRWNVLTGETLVAYGSNERLIVDDGSTFYDATPYRLTFSSMTNPFSTTSGSSTVTLTTPSPHEAAAGDEIVISSAPTTGGITGANLNGLRTIVSTPTATTLTFVAGANASSTTTGGTGTQVDFVLGKAPDGPSGTAGWGVGGWGRDGWGSPASASTSSGRLSVWSFDNFGENLVACRRGAGLYVLDYSLWPGRLAHLNTLPGATDVPGTANIIMVSERDRHVIAFGTVPWAGGSLDPLTIRWSDQENMANWDAADTTTTSGEIRLSRGVQIIAARQTRQEILVWTDNSLYSMRYQGGAFVFGVDLIGEGTDIAGQNAVVSYNDTAYWVGKGGFYAYNGQVIPLNSPLQKWFQDDCNWDQREKIYAGVTRSEGEIIFLYPSSTGSGDCDRYVIYNTRINCWYNGYISRTAWYDTSTGTNPIAASPDGYIYEHENGFDDGSTIPASGIIASATSSYLEIGDGQDVMFADQLIPDVSFLSSTNSSPSVTLLLNTRDRPGKAPFTLYEQQVGRTATIPVEEFTPYIDTRLRGRSISLGIRDNSTTGTTFRLGTPRIRVRTDGERE